MPLATIATVPDEIEGLALLTAERDGNGHVVAVRVILHRGGDEESCVAEIRPADRARVTQWLLQHPDPNNLLVLRKRAQLSQTQVEDAAGIPRGQLTHYERGHRRPMLRHASALAAVYGVTVADLGVTVYGT